MKMVISSFSDGKLYAYNPEVLGLRLVAATIVSVCVLGQDT